MTTARTQGEGDDVVAVVTTDLLPLSTWTGWADDPAAAQRAVLDATVQQAMFEAALAPSSTVAALDGVALRRLDPGQSVRDVLPDLDPDVLDAWDRTLAATAGWVHLIPEDGSHLGAWAVHRTGTVLGLLPGGAGGATLATPAIAQRAEFLLGVLNLVAAVGGAPGQYGALGTVAVFLVRMYGIAIAVLETAQVRPGNLTPLERERFDKEVRELMCGLIKGFLLAPAPISVLDQALGVADLGFSLFGAQGICGLVADATG